jgi:predicted signal transduction protein with EAL and GGDEF domain
MLGQYVLKTAVWVYDIDNFRFYTALLTDPSVLPTLQTRLHQDESYELDLLLNNHNGRAWYTVLCLSSKDAHGHKAILCQLHNIDARKKRERSLIEQASTDALTGLLNRRGFSDTIQPLLDAQQNMLVFYIDLDGFKMINDSLGHNVGDLVLVQVAKRLHECELRFY